VVGTVRVIVAVLLGWVDVEGYGISQHGKHPVHMGKIRNEGKTVIYRGVRGLGKFVEKGASLKC
jgi:hypothetical protein